MPGFSNPFYSSNNAPEIPPPPPSNRPVNYSSSPPAYSPPASSGAPAQYGSLADLTRGQQRPVPPPPPSRPAGGYAAARAESGSGGGAGGAYGQAAGPGAGAGVGQREQGRYGDGRNMPPAPSNYGQGIPSQPPRRNVPGNTRDPAAAPPQTQSAFSSYIPAGAQGYANTASSYANAGVSKARDGLDSVFTQQNRDKVASGVVGAAATGAKLLGKGAWQLGKFAANGGK